MTDETIVAVFDSADHATAAVRALEAAGVPSAAIAQHADAEGAMGGAGTAIGAPGRAQGFWSSLFGGDTDQDSAVYDRSIQSGSTVVTVKAPGEHLSLVTDILERHSPIDIDERASSYGATQTGAATGAGVMPLPAATTSASTAPMSGSTASAKTAGTAEGGTLQLSEESLTVGKRAVNRGTTRVRRYVVETPVEEDVTLREETVSVERRPVADGRAATAADFTDKVIEVSETSEEAVVSKTARVREEVVIHKEAAERTETVHDTVRREDVEIVKEGATAQTAPSGTAGMSATKPAI